MNQKLRKSIAISLITLFSTSSISPLFAGTIPAGTAVQLRLNQTISGKTAQTGSFVALSVINLSL